MVDQIRKPGVNVTQVFEGTPPTPVTANLVPCIVGPAFEVVDLVGDDGTASAESQVDTAAGPLLYRQLPIDIPVAEFPAPRADTSQMTVLDDEVEVALQRSGAFDILDRNPGTAFLAEANIATQPGIWFSSEYLLEHATQGQNIIVIVNNSITNNAVSQVVEIAVGSTVTEFMDALVADVDGIAYEAYEYDSVPGYIVRSTRFGASSSISIVSVSGASSSSLFTDKGASALTIANALVFKARGAQSNVLQVELVQHAATVIEFANDVITVKADYTNTDITYQELLDELLAVLGTTLAGADLYSIEAGADVATEAVAAPPAPLVAPANSPLQDSNGRPLSKVRVEGSGLYAKDSSTIGILTSPYVKHSRGQLIFVNDQNTSTVPGDNNVIDQIKAVHIPIDGPIIKSVNADPIDFTAYDVQAATPTSNGDLLTASGPYGQSLSRVMITEVQADCLRLGVVDTLRSEYDADGNPTNQRYVDFQLGALNNATPFAPKNAYFVAQNLTDLNPLALPAVHTSTATAITVAVPAIVDARGFTDLTSSNFSNLILDIVLTIDGVSETFSLPFQDADANTHVDAFNAIMANKVVVAFNGGDTFRFSSVEKSSSVSLKIVEASSMAQALVSQTVGGAITAIQDGADDKLDNFAGKAFSFRLNNGPRVYTFTPTSDSLRLFKTNVNNGMGYDAFDYTVDAADNATFTLTSYLLGSASEVRVIEEAEGIDALNFSDGQDTIGTPGGGDYAVGSGRPHPDVWVYSDGNVRINGDITRNSITGAPLSGAIGARVHVGYRALRLDLSPVANQPGIIRISSIDTLNSVFGPISVRNPFALAVYYAMLNAAEGAEINAIGLSDVSGSEAEGTTFAYKEALEFLRSYEVYSLVPLTSSEDVIAMFDAHVKSMSEPEQRAERTVISSPINPTRRNDEVVLSTGESGAQSTGNIDQVLLDDSPEATLGGLGIDTSGVIPFDLADKRQLYLHITVGDDSFRYSVSSVDGGRVTVRYAYTTEQNGDGYYSTDQLPSEFVGAEFSLALRGTVLTLPGSTLLDKTAYSNTIRDKAQQYLNRRQIRLYPDTVQSSAIGGVNQRLPSYYYAAALAGSVSNIEPQEPLTRVPMVGFNDVIGPDLERAHLNAISAGNAVIEVEIEGQAPALRMQGTTDPSTIENREWSITRAVDAFSKTIRRQLKSRIGRFNITQSYMDELTLLVDSVCTTAVSNGQFRSASVLKLEQDPTQPDSILVEIQLEVLYPANYINITLVV